MSFKMFEERELNLPPPSPFPDYPDNANAEESPSTPLPSRFGMGGVDEEMMKKIRLSSKLMPITGAVRMNTLPLPGAGGKTLSTITGSVASIAGERFVSMCYLLLPLFRPFFFPFFCYLKFKEG